MGRPRAFDWDEARRLRKQGLTYAEIGARLGVAAFSVSRACNAELRQRHYEATAGRLAQKRRPCLGGCGRPVWPHGQSGRCRTCAGELRRVAWHGTYGMYKRGCRCGICKRYSADARASTRGISAPAKHNHSGYSNGCRCTTCREATLVYRQKLRERRAAA